MLASACLGARPRIYFLFVPALSLTLFNPVKLHLHVHTHAYIPEQRDLYFNGSKYYHQEEWQKMVEVFEASLKELPSALQRCRDECYGPMKLGQRMGFAQVCLTLLPRLCISMQLFIDITVVQEHLIRTLLQYPKSAKSIHFSPWKEGTSSMKEL